jgi:DNA-binding XRE family transcriptional regulator
MGDVFADTVRRLRLGAGLTQEALAERSGVSVSTIRGLEAGRRRNPQLESVRLLAAALEVGPAERNGLLAAARDSGPASGLPAPGLPVPRLPAPGLPVPRLPVPRLPVPRLPVPRQLPAPPAPFVGRERELTGLDAVLGPDAVGTAVVSAIAGAGGVGKSWLVLHWAHRNAGRFPDGQLFVDLRGFSPDGDPMDPAVVVRVLLDALNVEPSRIPVATHAQAAFLHPPGRPAGSGACPAGPGPLPRPRRADRGGQRAQRRGLVRGPRAGVRRGP